MVNQVWGKHATEVTGTQDGTKQISKNEWNENLNRKGLLGFDSETIASASSVTIPDDSSDDVSSFIKLSGSTSVDTLVTTNTSEGDLLYIITTGSVTLNNTSSPSSAGDIRLLGNANLDLSTTVPTVLMRVGNFWYEYGGQINTAHTVDANNLTGTTLASGVVTSSITALGTIATGTWQGTVVADAYLGTGINALKLADGTVTNAELQYINTLGSNAQTQIDSKSATAGNGSLVTVGALDSGSITSGFGTINNGSSTITTTGALASGAITTSGTLTMGDNIITGIKSLDTDIDTLAYGASTVVDFDTNEELILGELTGNIAFTSSNRAIGKHKVIHMDSDGSARTFTFSEAWVFYGTKPTTTVADKKSILSLTCLGSAVGDVRAVFVEEA